MEREGCRQGRGGGQGKLSTKEGTLQPVLVPKKHLHNVIASPIHLGDAILALGTLQHPVALQVSACHQHVSCCIAVINDL